MKVFDDVTKIVFDNPQRLFMGLATFQKGIDTEKKIAEQVQAISALSKTFDRVTGAIGALGAGFSIVTGILGLIPGVFGPSAQEVTLSYLNEISQTTREILDSVRRIESTLENIEVEIQNLGNFLSQKIDSQVCTSAISKIGGPAGPIERISARWVAYMKDDGPRDALKQTFELIRNGTSDIPDPAPVYDRWAQKVLSENIEFGIEDAVDTLHANLVPSDRQVDRNFYFDQPLIKSCANAILNSWKLKDPGMKLPFDDRQYFSDITKIVRYYTLWMARGLLMIQEAWMFRAQERALKAWMVYQKVTGCGTNSSSVGRSNCSLDATQLPYGPLFCVQLKAADKAHPEIGFGRGFLSALAACKEFDKSTEKITNYTYALQDYAGIPYSWGDKNGEGVRLVLGSDVLGRNAAIFDPFTSSPFYRLFKPPFFAVSEIPINQYTRTEWLVAASPNAFFDRVCIPGNLPGNFSEDTRQKLQCRANPSDPFGTYGLQSIAGVNFEGSTRFASFFPQGYPLGYQSDLWQPAGSAVWNLGLRGMLAPVNPGYNPYGYSPNLKIGVLETMERGINEVMGAVPFANISNREWVSV